MHGSRALRTGDIGSEWLSQFDYSNDQCDLNSKPQSNNTDYLEDCATTCSVKPSSAGRVHEICDYGFHVTSIRLAARLSVFDENSFGQNLDDANVDALTQIITINHY